MKRSTLQRLIRQQPLGVISALILLTMGVVAIAAPVLAPYEPNRQHLEFRYEDPFGQFPLGTDEFGRDVLSRIIYGARISLFVGLASTLVGSSIGLFLGLTSGFIGGRSDLWIQRFIDTLQAFPGLILAMVLILVMGASLISVVIAVAVPSIPFATRVVRSVTLQVRQLDYVLAARSIGASDVRLMSRHIAPQLVAPIMIIWSAQVGAAIVTEATLSFMGLGVPPPTATWGQMLSRATQAFYLAPWLAIFPGIALSVTVFSVNFIGDTIRDVYDPRLRGR